jgi:hypothetical protein
MTTNSPDSRVGMPSHSLVASNPVLACSLLAFYSQDPDKATRVFDEGRTGLRPEEQATWLGLWRPAENEEGEAAGGTDEEERGVAGGDAGDRSRGSNG